MRPKPLGNLKGSDSRLALGVGDSDYGSARVEVAHLQARDLACAHSEHQRHRGGHAHRSLLWVIARGKLETHGQELSTFVDGKFLFSAVPLAFAFDVGEED